MSYRLAGDGLKCVAHLGAHSAIPDPQSLKNGMSSTATVVGGLVIAAAVVVIEDEMLSFIPDDLRHAREILRMFADHESRRTVRQDHPGDIDIAALIVIGARVLCRTDRDVG